MRGVSWVAFVLAATPALAQTPPPGAPVTPNAGPVSGAGQLTDNGGKPIGTWSLNAVLKAGGFSGAGVIAVNGTSVSLPLQPQKSYLENGKCYFEFEQGRTHVKIGGPCTTGGVAGTLSGFVAEGDIYSINGKMAGTLKFAAPSAAKAATAATLPTAKLTCAWMERIGGNVGGQDYHYELRFSNMASLQLTPGGTYRTASTSGAYVRDGDAIRLTSGQFAGAVGRLQPDKSGQPAVYFERDENRRPNGVHIVDPARTSCTVARGG